MHLWTPQTLVLTTLSVIVTCDGNIQAGSVINHRTTKTHIPCGFRDSLNITDGHWDEETNSYTHENQTYVRGQYGSFDYEISYGFRIPAKIHIRGCKCQNKPCIAMCCPFGQSYVPGTARCVSNQRLDNWQMLINASDLRTEINVFDNFNYVVRPKCTQMVLGPTETLEMSKNGMLSDGFLTYGLHEYCLMLPLNQSEKSQAYVCFKKEYLTKPWVLLSTVLFLLVTFTFYAVQSDRSNFHSLCLMSYLMALTLGYFCLAVGQHTLDWTKLNISLLGFTMYAAFMSAFLWLNIISFDIIWNFQNPRKNKQFRLYSMLVWGVTVLMVTIVVTIERCVQTSSAPGITNGTFLSRNEESVRSNFVFFYLPILISIVWNITVFMYIAIKIGRRQYEIERLIDMEERYRLDVQLSQDITRFGVFFRLFVLMAITWGMEMYVVYFRLEINQHQHIDFNIVDMVNMLQGPCIFILFTMNPNVKVLMLKRRSKLSNNNRMVPSNSFSSSRRQTDISLLPTAPYYTPKLYPNL